jgi:CRP-like cAMP-binding protein
MSDLKQQFKLLSFLFFFLFGGAIVGETVSLTMVVTILGPAIIGKLYLINGALLFLLPPLFFQNIDKVNRGKLLSIQLLVSAGILTVYFIGIHAIGIAGRSNGVLTFLILIIYPISYLSKTILFLTFWTLANDIYHNEEAKKGFPLVAAWGFVGGLSGACVARLLLEKVDAIMIIGVWIIAYSVGWFFSRKTTQRYWVKLLKKEESVQTASRENLFKSMRSVLDIKLIRLISVLYFCVFVAIFMQDYLFWKKSAALFPTSNALASFQFTFYLTYAFITVIGLRFAVPSMIYKWGFTRIFLILPFTLFGGSMLLMIMIVAGAGRQAFFIVFAVIQFARYVVFENAFSPIYQMFFAAIPREKRGRAKTFLEGIIKPCAIMVTGLVLIPIDKVNNGIVIIIGIMSISMIGVVFRLRETYLEALIPRTTPPDTTQEIISKIGSYRDLKIVSLIKQYSHSTDVDIRSLCVKILAHDGSRRAFKIVVDIFENEHNKAVKEIVARSLTHFSINDAKPFIERLLNDDNPRIRANALYSINQMECLWKRQLHDTITPMIYDNNPRIQIEAARYIWALGDKEKNTIVINLLESLRTSKNSNKRSAGIFLIGALKPEGWEVLLLENLQSSSLQVFGKCVDVIFRSASRKTRLKTLDTIESMSRSHISMTGKILRSIGMPAFDGAVDFLRKAHNQRMIVEVIHALRMAIDPGKPSNERIVADKETKTVVVDLIRKDLEQVYRDSFLWWQFRSKAPDGLDNGALAVLEDALHDQLLRVCERALDVMVLLDKNGMISSVSRDFDLRDYTQRLDVAEIIESLSDSSIAPFIVPILRSDAWEDIAKIGKNRFHFEDDTPSDNMHYFVKSKNKWICFCALYYLYKSVGRKVVFETEKTILMTLHHDPNIYLSRVACHLLSNSGSPGFEEIDVEPFELLERVMSLKKTALFHSIPAEKLMGLAEIARSMSFKSGTLISREGEVSDHLYIVRTGSLKIVKSKNNVKTILTILRAGETYGEIGLFNQAPRSASAIAHEDCELWVIQRSSLKKFLLEMPEIAYNFLEVFSEKLRKNSEEIAQLHSSFANSKKDYLL